jgi:25S rRNA (uracil2634-N3)-methyltransferase
VTDDEDEDADVIASHDALAAAITAGVAKTFHPPTKQGTVLITLKNSAPYTLWDIHHLATRPPAHPVRRRAGDLTDDKQPRYRLLRSFAFDPTMWPGYEHRRTLGFKEGVSKAANLELMQGGGLEGETAIGLCKTWEFEPRYERSRDRR